MRATFCCLLRHHWCHCRTRLVRTFSCVVFQDRKPNMWTDYCLQKRSSFPTGAIGFLKTVSYFANLRKITLDTACASNRYPKGIHLHIQRVVVDTYWILIVYLWCTYGVLIEYLLGDISGIRRPCSVIKTAYSDFRKSVARVTREWRKGCATLAQGLRKGDARVAQEWRNPCARVALSAIFRFVFYSTIKDLRVFYQFRLRNTYRVHTALSTSLWLRRETNDRWLQHFTVFNS